MAADDPLQPAGEWNFAPGIGDKDSQTFPNLKVAILVGCCELAQTIRKGSDMRNTGLTQVFGVAI